MTNPAWWAMSDRVGWILPTTNTDTWWVGWIPTYNTDTWLGNTTRETTLGYP